MYFASVRAALYTRLHFRTSFPRRASRLNRSSARKKMRKYRSVAVYDNGVDIYYLLTLKPRQLDTTESWSDVCADTLVQVMIAPAYVKDIERVTLSEDERKPPERRDRETCDEFDRRLTAFRVKPWCDLCHIVRHDWLDGERAV